MKHDHSKGLAWGGKAANKGGTSNSELRGMEAF
eukprot:SAG22_NODE_312_length_12614_cov_4.783540_6_plen_33_part_00